MKTLQMLLAAALVMVSGLTLAMGPYGYLDPEPGEGPWGYVGPYGPQGPKATELDPVDADAKAFPGVDETGFGQWADSDAGAQQPGQGAPWSGIRPPK